jgi:probable F420-dependent oxidoreductase
MPTTGVQEMQFGAVMFFTDYSMGPAELGLALEQRGFESLWVPEHSHIPLARTTEFPSGGDLPKAYYDIMDPFIVLTAAAAATQRLKLGTGVCLIAQRDPIQTAKLVASIDQVSNGRFLFGVGNGWNVEEMANHGTAFATRHKLARERLEAMKVIWTEAKPEYHGEFVDFASMQSWPKPVQTPYPPIIVGGAFPYGARRAIRYGDGWIPRASRQTYSDVGEFLPQFRQMAIEAGRDPASLPVTIFRVEDDLDRIRHYRDIGVTRVVISVPAAKEDEVLPLLDRWTALIARV